MSPGDSANLILTGFMGTGKSSVGKEVARRLNRRFVDMDAEIEARIGKPIRHIFAEDGEAAFREMEATICKELGEQEGLVVATGGGALVIPDNRTALMKSGIVICLTCDVDEILRRVGKSDVSDRPLIDVVDPRTEIQHLLQERREMYEAIPWQIDTTALEVDEIAERVMRLVDIGALRVRYAGG